MEKKPVPGKNEEVNQAFDLLISCMDECVQDNYERIKKLANEQNGSEISSSLEMAQRIEKIKNQVISSSNEWKGLFVVYKENDTAQVSEKSKNDVADRTSWKKADNSIRIETQRIDGPAYSNTFPLLLFKRIAKSAFAFTQQNGYVKTSDVYNSLKNEIISGSDYKRAPRMPIYATFKVLVKEKLFKIDENNSHKYLRMVSSEEFNKWLEMIGKAEP